MKVEVIDDADKGVGQRANGCYRNPLLKGGQELEKLEVHVIGHRAAWTHMQIRSFYMGRRGEAWTPKWK